MGFFLLQFEGLTVQVAVKDAKTVQVGHCRGYLHACPYYQGFIRDPLHLRPLPPRPHLLEDCSVYGFLHGWY